MPFSIFMFTLSFWQVKTFFPFTFRDCDDIMTQVKITFLTIINILISTKRRIKSVLRPLQKWTEDDLAPLQEICSIRVLFISYGATGTRFMKGYKSRLWLYITCERWQGWSHIMRVRVVTSEELPCVPVFLYPPNLTFYLLVSGDIVESRVYC